MARILIVGCGCRGRELGRSLVAQGWLVRGTTRRAEAVPAIEAAGIEPVLADPDRVAEVTDAIPGVSVIAWLLGSARGPAERVKALHAARLERLCEEIVDTSVRGVLYEAAGALPPELLDVGAKTLAAAGARWRIHAELLRAEPRDWRAWRDAAVSGAHALLERP